MWEAAEDDKQSMAVAKAADANNLYVPVANTVLNRFQRDLNSMRIIAEGNVVSRRRKRSRRRGRRKNTVEYRDIIGLSILCLMPLVIVM